jgi:hypothetical protein
MKGLRRVLGFGLVLTCLLPASLRAENWGITTAGELGITQDEFIKVKEKGMSRSQLLHLLEIGVRPKVYFTEPWKKLGVSESYWLEQKKAGLEDDDINASYGRHESGEITPLIAFVLPGYYHYRSHRPYTGALLSTLAVGSIATLAFARDVPPPYPIAVLAASMLWSAGDAFFHTRFADNPNARRFSLNLAPLPRGGEIMLALKF